MLKIIEILLMCMCVIVILYFLLYFKLIEDGMVEINII